MPFDDETEVALRALLGSIEVVGVPPRDGSEEYLFSHGGGDTGVLLRGEALGILRRLSHDLSESALSSGGKRPRSVEQKLIACCHRSIRDGADAAISALEAEFETAPRVLTVLFDCQVHVAHDRDLDVAGGRVAHTLPANMQRAYDVPDPPFFVVDVIASDDESARILAADRYEEAMAILALADLPPYDYPIPRTWFGGAEGRTGFHSGSSRAIVVRKVNPPEATDYSALWPEYQALAEAAALPDDEREEWVGRCLRAARWLRAAESTVWPSLALSAAMSAMECILVRSMAERDKGNTIAARVYDIGIRLRGHSAESQRDWFVDQYKIRNAAVHEGLSASEELEVETVMNLARSSVHWAIRHLQPFHGVPGNAVCSTFDEVHDLERHPRWAS